MPSNFLLPIFSREVRFHTRTALLGKIQLRGIKIFWSAVAFEQDQFGASFWGDFPKGTVKDSQTHQELQNLLTPVEVASKTIPALNEHVIGRPIHSYQWSASDRQQWWDWSQVATDANKCVRLG